MTPWLLILIFSGTSATAEIHPDHDACELAKAIHEDSQDVQAWCLPKAEMVPLMPQRIDYE